MTQKESLEINPLHRFYRIRNQCDVPPMNSLTDELESSGINSHHVILKPDDREDTIDPLKPIFHNHGIGSTPKRRWIMPLKVLYIILNLASIGLRLISLIMNVTEEEGIVLCTALAISLMALTTACNGGRPPPTS